LKKTFRNILFFIFLSFWLSSCNAVKSVPEGKNLLIKNAIYTDSTLVKDERVYSILKQHPNPKVLGIPFGIFIYNLAKPEPDSSFTKWLQKKPRREEKLVKFLSKKQLLKLKNSYINFNEWLKKSGSEPVVIDEDKINQSVKKLEDYYYSFGWFNRKVSYNVEETGKKRASISYQISLGKPYMLGTITDSISSPVVDSLYRLTKNLSFLKTGNQYSTNDFVNERERLTLQFRNSGLYHFTRDYITVEGDTVNTDQKVNATLIIPNRTIKKGDSTYAIPFKIHKINQVRIITDFSYLNQTKSLNDSINFQGYKLYAYDKIKFKPKAITNAVSIVPNTIYKDLDRTFTYNQLRDLQIFDYPTITYSEDPKDSTGTGLIASILLTPKKRFGFSFNADAFTSTIQQLGVGFGSSFLIRNVFRRAENLELSISGSLGSSKDAAERDSRFFNISDIGGNLKLRFPRIIFPVKTEKIIPKFMSPQTQLNFGFNAQNNIGLDRQNTNASFSYSWKSSKTRRHKFELLNLQYVRNLNPTNYFNVYKNSFNKLNQIAIASGYDFNNSSDNPSLEIPTEAETFIQQITSGNTTGLSLTENDINDVLSIAERKDRLTEDNLISASSYTWTKDNREGISDNSFSRLRLKAEVAGNLLSGIASVAGLNKDENGNYKIFGVVFSQYVKLESEYIKHWQLGNTNNIIAMRAFGGIALPYGNSNSIPFTRSYFAGGSNDNRGWRAYDLGPGSSGGQQDFNEANFKLAFNTEYRFTILGSFKGALFADVGNIWNVKDNVTDPTFTFEGLSDLKELAVATGFGFRYDFGVFVLRIDTGFKTYNPSRTSGNRWFKEYNFSKAVYNIGINYPF
jgi:outer membrane protein assembly factor BamA